ncbi:prephenate dehydrogenase [Rhodococcus sp. PAMC28707]|uniref:prephenate dehydrogenase dimerization domain-containing protein n=1 Tax=unclassified Rhodococcus (in: high G+C Gram-positive bacteria) TaxID=192944 RepID=UPI00109D9500|nr:MULTISPECIES: prephenate dehydrogenase dimerization domain-containing protein [unclassified Rhodococcus (in: high G+C Gram-positive bacteria)]QCB50494.1 prephenate dehydrogenase [Rhodococcus sp. PAMC28705]QCB57814.1 prephenate dehydrogenase [Rhodococcus sp. PAMC28707]
MTRFDAVVIGGSGEVGRMIASLLAADGDSVLTVDPAAPSAVRPGIEHLVGDIVCPDLEVRAVLRATPLVVLAVPESVALATELSFLHEQSLLVETLSVKSAFAQKVDDADSSGSILGINPMFAPSLGMDGRPVAAVVHRDGGAVEGFLGRISDWGGRVVHVDAEQHDRLAAATQALTHATVLAFGSALAKLEVDPKLIASLAPPPATTLLALVDRVAGGEPEVYWDVQSGNPYAGRARSALTESLRELNEIVASESESETAFTSFMTRAGAAVPNHAQYQALCAQLFGIVRGTAPEGDRS